MRTIFIAALVVLTLAIVIAALLVSGAGDAGAGNHCDNIRVPEEAKKLCPTPIPTNIDTPIDSPTPSPRSTPPPNVTPTTTSGPGSPTILTLTTINQASPTPISGMLSGFPNTGAGGSDGGVPAWRLVLTSLLVGVGVVALVIAAVDARRKK